MRKELEWEEGKVKEVAIAEMTDQSVLQSLQALQSVLKKSPCRDPDCPHWDGDRGGTTSLSTRGLGLDTSLSSGELGASLEGTV